MRDPHTASGKGLIYAADFCGQRYQQKIPDPHRDANEATPASLRARCTHGESLWLSLYREQIYCHTCVCARKTYPSFLRCVKAPITDETELAFIDLKKRNYHQNILISL